MTSTDVDRAGGANRSRPRPRRRRARASSTSAGCTPRATSSPPHLASRDEVGDILLASGVPTAVLRAAVIIGSGSASFEMLRYLTERLPVDDHPALGAQPDPADRRPRRAALPGRRGRPCRPR